MIQEIYDYGCRKGIIPTPGFMCQKIHFGLYLKDDGTILVEPLGDKEGKEFDVPFLTPDELRMSRVKASPKKGSCPGAPGRHFLWDDVATVTMSGKASKAELGKELQAWKHESFLEMLERASAGGVKDAGRCADVLRRRLPEVQVLVEKAAAKRNCKITLNVDGEWLVERLDWREWWKYERSRINALRKKSGKLMVSVASGRIVSPEQTHQPIKKIVGGAPQGAKLACFDKPSFQSYGLSGGEHAPVSEEEEVGYRTAMNALASDGVSIPGSTVIWWVDECDHGDDDKLKKYMGMFGAGVENEEVDVQKVRDLLKSIENGERPKTSNANYTIMIMSGVQSRIMTRSFAKGKVADLLRNVSGWFDHTSVATNGGISRPFKLRKFLYTLFCPPKSGSQSKRADDYVPSHCAVQLFEAAIRGRAIPEVFVQKAMLKHRSKILGGDDVTADPAVMTGIMKAYLTRKCLLTKKGNAMSTSLNPDHPSVAYQCGRLFAELAKIQSIAIPDVGSSIVDRYYNSVLNNPGAFLPVLRGKANFHLKKIRQDRPGLAFLLDSRVSAIVGKIVEFPMGMSFDQKAEFLCGYDHAKADMEEERIKNAKNAKLRKEKAEKSVGTPVEA